MILFHYPLKCHFPKINNELSNQMSDSLLIRKAFPIVNDGRVIFRAS